MTLDSVDENRNHGKVRNVVHIYQLVSIDLQRSIAFQEMPGPDRTLFLNGGIKSISATNIRMILSTETNRKIP